MDLLARFGVTSDDLLGEGGEARVYALSDETVLRVLKTKEDREAHLIALQDFYEGLVEAADQLPFALPRVLEIGEHEGQLFTIDARILGTDFAVALRTLNGEDRTRAYRSYLEAAAAIARLPRPDGDYGEVLMPTSPLRAPTWSQFLRERSARAADAARGFLDADVPDLRQVLRRADESFDALDGKAPSLVHGDYFPGNVLIGDDLAITGVLDFGPLTVVGDARMDIAGAVVFAEVCDGYRAEDTPLLLELLEAVAPVAPEVLAAYRVYYSLYFAFIHDEDRELYDWCVANLNSWSTS